MVPPRPRTLLHTAPKAHAVMPSSSLLPARTLLKRAPRRAFATSAAPCADKPVMNRYSRTITKPKSQGASQAMLYDTDGIRTDEDFDKAMVGVASVW